MEHRGTLTRRLRKADVERLLADYDADPIAALTAALRTTLARPEGTWEELLASAPIGPERRQRLMGGDVAALDDLVRELNERRCLGDPE